MANPPGAWAMNKPENCAFIIRVVSPFLSTAKVLPRDRSIYRSPDDDVCGGGLRNGRVISCENTIHLLIHEVTTSCRRCRPHDSVWFISTAAVAERNFYSERAAATAARPLIMIATLFHSSLSLSLFLSCKRAGGTRLAVGLSFSGRLIFLWPGWISNWRSSAGVWPNFKCSVVYILLG